MQSSLVRVLCCLAAGQAAWLAAEAVDSTAIAWRLLQPGVEYEAIDLTDSPASRDPRLHLVRIDPAVAELKVALASQYDRQTRTAAEWCRTAELTVAINAGMYRSDFLSNVGYLRAGTHLNQPKWTAYRSALAFGPSAATLAKAVIVDLDEPGARERLGSYRTVIQNLRLIRAADGKGRNVWQQQSRRWSEAAIAMSSDGRLFFLFSRTPFSMWELNQRLLTLPLRIVRAMHVEGGPEASLSVHAGGLDLDLNGSYETGFHEADDLVAQWRIPNVVGVVKKP